MCHKDQVRKCTDIGFKWVSIFTALFIVLGGFIWIGKLILTPSSDSETPIEPTKFIYYLRTDPGVGLGREHVANLGSKPTSAYFYIHGFQSPDLEQAESIKIKDAILQTENEADLVILVDWCEESKPGFWDLFSYPAVASFTVPKVAAQVKNEIIWIRSSLGIPPNRVKMAGHSLGAHVMGRAGELLAEDGGGRVAQMTGLDPAGPLFDDVFPSGDHRLTREDATHVLCIHTDDTLGTTNRTFCHAHLYPTQETCGVGGFCCRHNSAKQLFIGYLKNCPGLRDEVLEVGGWRGILRGLLKGHFRAVTIACIYSTPFAVLYVAWLVVFWVLFVSVISCYFCPVCCLLIGDCCIHKTGDERGGGGGREYELKTLTALSPA